MKLKVLWIGDAVAQTGFARVTHGVCDRMHASGSVDVNVLGVNYRGDPHRWPYKIFPAVIGGDPWGVGRVQPLVGALQPDVIVIVNDPWIIPHYLEELRESFPNVPVVAYMPVDAPNQSDRVGKQLGALSRAITYTLFGRKELVLAGYTGRCDVIPHGVDLSLYQPVSKREALEALTFSKKLPAETFIVSNVNRNQPRKRLDLTIQYWTQWWVNAGQPKNAYLYLHTGNNDTGWNVLQLAKYYGIDDRLIITNPKMSVEHALAEDMMKYVYCCADVNLTTTVGEGWGLTQHESMACGIPQIMPRYSGLGEWAKDAARFVKCTTFQATPSNINTVGGIPDATETVAALQEMYASPELRAEYGAKALARATEDRFNWSNIAELFHVVLLETVSERRKPAPMGVEA